MNAKHETLAIHVVYVDEAKSGKGVFRFVPVAVRSGKTMPALLFSTTLRGGASRAGGCFGLS